MAPHASLFDLIDHLRSAPPSTRAVVEGMIGAKLATTDENEAFRTYETHNVKLQGATLSRVDFREPVPGGGATAGPFLVLDVTGECVERDVVEKRFGTLRFASAPSPHQASGTGKFAYSRPEPWGRLTFGFADREPRCLTSIVFDVGASDAK